MLLTTIVAKKEGVYNQKISSIELTDDTLTERVRLALFIRFQIFSHINQSISSALVEFL
jgi:hypothetical protein